MQVYEDLIRSLGLEMQINLVSDSHQSCRIEYSEEQVTIQIDLDTTGDRLLIGTQLGEIPPGAYRHQVFVQALRVNGISKTPRGTLAFSEKNNTLVLFHYIPIATAEAKSISDFIELFTTHAKVWVDAIKDATIPQIEEDPGPSSQGSGMFGMKP